ncbi:DUF4190 domain-containing protein [Nocardioides pakistanensis]
MTNTPGDQPTQPEPEEPTGEQPGFWEQQAQSQQPSPYYGQPAYPPYAYAPDHPKATTTLVLGILGLVVCGVVAPFAWVMGKRTLEEIDASNGRIGGRGAAQAGYVLGIVGTVILALGLALVLIYVLFMVAIIGGGIATS